MPTQTPIPPETAAGTHLYRIRNTGFTSARFGVCEVCRAPCSEVFYQVESVTFDDDGAMRQTYAGCSNLFGHEACLIKSRRA